MPGFDGTGPMGMGAMTGDARGPCNVYGHPYARGGFRPRLGMGRGRGYRNMFWATGLPRGMRSGPFGPGDYPVSYSKGQEMDFLRDQAAALKSELDAIEARLRTVESEEKASA